MAWFLFMQYLCQLHRLQPTCCEAVKPTMLDVKEKPAHRLALLSSLIMIYLILTKVRL